MGNCLAYVVSSLGTSLKENFRILALLITRCFIYKWNIFRILFVDGMGSMLRILLQMSPASFLSTIQIEKIFPPLAGAKKVAKIQKDEGKFSCGIFAIRDRAFTTNFCSLRSVFIGSLNDALIG